jgi:hypothetical protein
MNKNIDVAVYYFPNYHIDPRNEAWHGKAWTEWELVKQAQPRFDGHEQPKVPLWGYLDESDPKVSARQIDAAADHGIDTFIFDWYWYEDGPFLNGALDRGFLQAHNNSRLKFSLMWANHDWINIHPYKRSTDFTVLSKGGVSRQAFQSATDHVINNYFSHPSYWRVNGGLYFSIYELMSLVQGLGGIEATKDALENFRRKTREAGLGELHLNAVVWGVQILPQEQKIMNPNELLDLLGIDSVTSYVWIHHVPMEQFPTVDYVSYAKRAIDDWERLTADHEKPYYPNVSMGWDASPRTVQTDKFDSLGYPFTPVLTGNTPSEFEKALTAAKRYIEQSALPHPYLTINSWNEWTEGSYIEPDTKHGYGYLEAIQRVFGSKQDKA